jgi:hypothetical protein
LHIVLRQVSFNYTVEKYNSRLSTRLTCIASSKRVPRLPNYSTCFSACLWLMASNAWIYVRVLQSGCRSPTRAETRAHQCGTSGVDHAIAGPPVAPPLPPAGTYQQLTSNLRQRLCRTKTAAQKAAIAQKATTPPRLVPPSPRSVRTTPVVVTEHRLQRRRLQTLNTSTLFFLAATPSSIQPPGSPSNTNNSTAA